MAQIIKSLSLDVSRQNRIRAILAKQFDNGSRFLNIQLNNEGEPITVAKTSVVLINATRADGESESFMGVVNDDGSVTVPITYWMLEVPGRVKCDISVISEQGSKLSSLGFAIEVEKTNGDDENIGEQENCGILVQLISDVKQLEDNFKTVFIRYSANADGENYSETWSEGMEYIGIANTDIEPRDKNGYVWCRFAATEQENSITVDAELSLVSENPVQNKAVTQEFKAFSEALGETNRRVSSLESGSVGGGSGGGVSSWNDLTDKPFSDDVITTIFEGVLQDERDTTGNWSGELGAEDTSDAALVEGQTYIYTWNGVQYMSECIEISENDTNNLVIGNTPAFVGGSNGQPVVIFRKDTNWVVMVVDIPEDTDGTYQLKIETAALKQIDNKYLAILDKVVGGNLLPSTTGMSTLNTEFQIYGVPAPTSYLMAEYWHFKNKDNVFVEFDGETYECAPQYLEAINAMAVGNCSAFGGTGNSEPFLVSIMATNGYVLWMVACLGDTAPTEHTVRVYQADKWEVKEEYLPDVAQPVSIDLSRFDTNGTIVETYADGTVKISTMEFDENGNPIKITDGDGNVTTLTW